MANITFFSNFGFTVYNTGSSGLAFFGDAGFGFSVAVGSYQGRTFISDSTGTVMGQEINNCQYINTSGVAVGVAGGGSGIHLLALPNYLTTLNPRFTHTSAVATQNVKFYVYDGSNKNNDPSGVTCQVAQIIHPNTPQSLTGSGSTNWTNCHGSGSILSLVSSPGTSGLSPNGPNTRDTQHDWYLALSSQPLTVGSKSFSGLLELEYL